LNRSFSVYYGKIGDEQRQSIISYWKDNKIQIMIETNTFSTDVNSPDVYLVVCCVAPLNMSK
ncbi:hypothetical protein C1645_690708, partial [Glomus cerebriforme]